MYRFQYKKKITQNYPKTSAIGFVVVVFFATGLKNKFEIAVVNAPSVFEPLKFYCILVFFFFCFFFFASLSSVCCFSHKLVLEGVTTYFSKIDSVNLFFFFFFL